MPGVRNVDRVILAAIILSIPSFRDAFGGDMSIAALFVRLALALVLCWAGVAIIERVYDNYSRQARQKELARQLQEITMGRREQHDNGTNTAPGGR